ncbi:cubilin [Caerostris extrusa]|uniref:Cubilin n=1 Tax=Caerostris extrusa TaxID=172846 RepID=A0AAV4S3F9_CAEEX|nr:cubilin [Caerostris extrusa]
MSFRQFDVESSEACEYDYLEVDGKKICGTLPTNEIRMVDFRDYQTIFTFHSDSANSKSGFVIKWNRRSVKKCPPTSTLPKTSEESPPKFEPHYHFEPPCREPPLVEEPFVYPQLHFEYEHLVDYPIYEASSLQHGKPELRPHFPASRVRNPSVNFPLPYPNGLNCRYLVQKASDDICWVKLVFLRFDLEPVTIVTSITSASMANAYVAPCKTMRSVRAYLFNSEEISMYFRSDGANAHRGFLIRGEQLKCQSKGSPPPKREIHFSENGRLHEFYHKTNYLFQSKPRRPLVIEPSIGIFSSCRVRVSDPYPAESDCTFTIRKANRYICGLQLTILAFDVENEASCGKDYLQIEGDKLCGPIPTRTITSTVGECSQEYSVETFLLQSPKFPEDYPADSSCEYRIKRKSPSHCRLELRVLSFDVEEGTDGRCDADCLELPAGFLPLCGQLPKDHTESLLFSQDEIVLKFRSDSTTQRPGFSIQVRQVTDCVPTAASVAPEEEEEKCGGKQSESVCGLELKFAHFDVEKGPDCSYDYLDIGHKTICGLLPSGFTRVIPFENADMKFTFHSDKGTSKSGFAIKVRQRSDCGTTWKPATPPTRMCDHCLKENRGHLISPDYPDNYPGGLKCTYHLQRAKSFCGLEIFFHDFQLQDTPGCTGDALVIVAGEEEERVCGTTLKSKMKKLDFPIGEPNEIVLQFESDDQGSAQGFHAEYRQIPCRGYPWRQGRSMWTPSNGTDWIRKD